MVMDGLRQTLTHHRKMRVLAVGDSAELLMMVEVGQVYVGQLAQKGPIYHFIPLL